MIPSSNLTEACVLHTEELAGVSLDDARYFLSLAALDASLVVDVGQLWVMCDHPTTTFLGMR
jgi:hypothetical protein